MKERSSIIGGVISSTLMTLFLLPVLFDRLETFRAWRRVRTRVSAA